MIRPRVGIVLDYSLRIPEFKDMYLKLKEQILVGMSGAANLQQEDLIDQNSYWNKAVKENPAIIDFYSKQIPPTSNSGKDFDITLKKYFMTNEHRLKFLEEWSYALYGQGAINNKSDVNVINTAQSKLCDIVLIDRCTHTRKIPNTFAFLSRAGLFVKQVVFTNTEDEINEVKKDLIGCYDPFEDPSMIIEVGGKYSTPSKSLMDWFMKVEKQIKDKVK